MSLPQAAQDHLTRVIPTLEGWCSVEKAIRLAELVLQERPRYSVDLGVFGGRSLLALKIGHEQANTGMVVGFDPYTTQAALEGTNDVENDRWWSALNLGELYLDTAWRFLSDDRVRIIRAASQEGVGLFRASEVALLHQDSNHSEEVSCAELAMWREKMAPSGLWIMDDAEWPSLQKVQQIAKEEYGFVLEEDWTQWRVYRVPR